MKRRTVYVSAWGFWFSLVHGWQRQPELERSYCDASAAIVKDVQPGVSLVEVSA